MTQQEIAALLAERNALLAEKATLKAEAEAKAAAKITIKVSKSGGISLYGMGRFPITLYPEQWAQVFGLKGQIDAVINQPAAQFEAAKQAAIAKALLNPYKAK